jgi:hypothetical protein
MLHRITGRGRQVFLQALRACFLAAFPEQLKIFQSLGATEKNSLFTGRQVWGAGLFFALPSGKYPHEN